MFQLVSLFTLKCSILIPISFFSLFRITYQFQDNSIEKRRVIIAKEIGTVNLNLTTAPYHFKMLSYFRAKRCRVNKLVRKTEKEILSEYKLNVAVNSRKNIFLESTDPVAASSECLLDLTVTDLPPDLPSTSNVPLDLPTMSDLPLNRPLIISDQSENIDSSDAHFESIADDDEIEPEDVFDSSEHNEDFLMTSLKYWATSYSVRSQT